MEVVWAWKSSLERNFGEDLKVGVAGSPMNIGSKFFSGQRSNRCKGPEVGTRPRMVNSVKRKPVRLAK